MISEANKSKSEELKTQMPNLYSHCGTRVFGKGVTEVDGNLYGYYIGRMWGKKSYCFDAFGDVWSTDKLSALNQTLQRGLKIEFKGR